MHLIIRTDGRTQRVTESCPRADRTTAWLSLGVTGSMGTGFTEEQTLPIVAPKMSHSEPTFTLWIGEPSLHGVGLRNIPAALLGAQWGIPARVLCGPVVVTCDGSQSSAYVENLRWKYVEAVVEDITRAIHGLPTLHQPQPGLWREVVSLTAAVLRAAPRPEVGDLTGEAAINYLIETDPIDLSNGDDA